MITYHAQTPTPQSRLIKQLVLSGFAKSVRISLCLYKVPLFLEGGKDGKKGKGRQGRNKGKREEEKEGGRKKRREEENILGKLSNRDSVIKILHLF